MEIGCSGFDEVDEGRFCLVLSGEGSTGEKVIEVLEKMVVGGERFGGYGERDRTSTLNSFNFRVVVCETC